MDTPKGFTHLTVLVPITYKVVMIEDMMAFNKHVELMEIDDVDNITDATFRMEAIQDTWTDWEAQPHGWSIDYQAERATWCHDNAMVIIYKE